LPLDESEILLGDIVIKEGSRGPAHVERNVHWVNLIKQPNVISKLLLNFELEVVHVEVIDGVLELKQVLI